MSAVVRSTRAMLYGALLGMLIQAAAPAFQALHSAQHASEHAAADAVAIATHDDFSSPAVRSRAPADRHENDDTSGVACKVCKSHARLGSVLPTARTLTPDAVECDGAPAALRTGSPRSVSHLRAQPRAPPHLVS